MDSVDPEPQLLRVDVLRDGRLLEHRPLGLQGDHVAFRTRPMCRRARSAPAPGGVLTDTRRSESRPTRYVGGAQRIARNSIVTDTATPDYNATTTPGVT